MADIDSRPAIPSPSTIGTRPCPHHDRWTVRRLAGARLVSAGGSQAAQIALVYRVYEVTHSGEWVAAALLASISVGGLLGPLSGWVADRFVGAHRAYGVAGLLLGVAAVTAATAAPEEATGRLPDRHGLSAG
jgi:MFS family permease